MQQLALQQPVSNTYPTKIKALDRDARDPNHATGGSFHAAVNEKSGLKPNSNSEGYAGISSLAGPSQAADSTLTTNDVVGSALSIASGALLGGPIGALTAAAGEIFEAISGDSLIGHLTGLFTDTAAPTTSLASANRAYLSAGKLTP